MTASKPVTPIASSDPDDAPESTDDFFARADAYEGTKFLRRGRPRKPATKVPTTIQLDADTLEALKASGPGWQTRVNAAVGRLVKEGRL